MNKLGAKYKAIKISYRGEGKFSELKNRYALNN
jgi:hypothetical protein